MSAKRFNGFGAQPIRRYILDRNEVHDVATGIVADAKDVLDGKIEDILRARLLLGVRTRKRRREASDVL